MDNIAGDTDENLYVTIGTPFDLLEENEPLPKASKVEDQIVTDGKGRRRFHGAFTGGFSAGYFNTVGSREGWQPSTFKSSRSKTQDNSDESDINAKYAAKPEDFMDEEDFADHGIAPKQLKTIISYDSTERELENHKKSILKAVDDGDIYSAIPGGIPLDDLLVTTKQSHGIQLLKKMGWKPGQGVGEKVELFSEKGECGMSNKVYGCALPPKSKTCSDVQYLTMLAPKDIQPINFTHKANLHGIGYSGLVPTQGMFATPVKKYDKIFQPTGKGKKGIRGQAFGIGVFEEEDDDIYGDDSLSAYDMTMGDETDNKNGWSGSLKQSYKGCLPGFIKSSKSLSALMAAVIIQVPPDVPRHVFPEDEQNKNATNISNNKSTNTLKESQTKLSSIDRGNLLGEITKDVGDIKHWTLKWDQSVDHDGASEKNTSNESILPKETKKSRFSSRWDKDVDQIRPKQKKSEAELISASKKSFTPMYDKETGGFKPFAKYPEKQARYEIYQSAKKKGVKPDIQYDKSLTEWEREQEMTEFSCAAVLYQPIISAMSNRFTRANFDDEGILQREKDEPADKEAAEMAQTVMNWHPDSVLCKRMNIPNPYPGSSIKGVPERSGNKKQSFFANSSTECLKTITFPVVSKKSSFSDEDEIFTRLNKSKLKSLKNKVAGPLSHLNIKIDCQSVDKEIDNLGQCSGITNEAEEKDIAKPSIDIFKAIFADSDSDVSDIEDINEGNASVAARPEPVKTESAFDESKIDISITENTITDHPTISKYSNDSPHKSKDIDTRSTTNNQNILTNETSASKSVSVQPFLPLAFLNMDKMPEVCVKVKTNLEATTHHKNDATIDLSAGRSTGIFSVTAENNIKHNCDGLPSNKEGCIPNKHSDTSKHKRHSRNKHKTNKEKKSKKHKKKKYESDDSDSDPDKYYKKKKSSKNSGGSNSDCDENYKQKKSKKYNSEESHSSDKKKKTSKKCEQISSSSPDKYSLVPSNSLLLEKLKGFSNSANRPKAADFM